MNLAGTTLTPSTLTVPRLLLRYPFIITALVFCGATIILCALVQFLICSRRLRFPLAYTPYSLEQPEQDHRRSVPFL